MHPALNMFNIDLPQANRHPNPKLIQENASIFYETLQWSEQINCYSTQGDLYLALVQCWGSVKDAAPALNQRWPVCYLM